MKKVNLFALFIMLSFVGFAQNSIETFTTSNGQRLISVNVRNIMSVYTASLSTWENKMQSLNAGGRKVANDGISYSLGSTLGGGIQVIGKYADGVSIMWLHANNKTTIMNEIVDELKPHYLGTDNDYAMYGLMIGKTPFKVRLIREEKSEFIIFERE